MSKYGVFLIRILPHSDWIHRDTKYLSVFSPNAGKYAPEKTPYLDNFHAVIFKANNKSSETMCKAMLKVDILGKDSLKSTMFRWAFICSNSAMENIKTICEIYSKLILKTPEQGPAPEPLF